MQDKMTAMIFLMAILWSVNGEFVITAKECGYDSLLHAT
jgi:hypothetical protein